MRRLPISFYNQVKQFRERQGSLMERHLDSESKVWLLFRAHLLIHSFIEQKWVLSVTGSSCLTEAQGMKYTHHLPSGSLHPRRESISGRIPAQVVGNMEVTSGSGEVLKEEEH